MPHGAEPCVLASAAAGETLAGTAITARRWLAVEWRSAWGREGVPDSGLPEEVLQTLTVFDGRPVLVRGRSRSRSGGVTVFVGRSEEEGGTLARLVLRSIDALASADLATAEPVDGPLVLVCGHGKRDACCARLGPAFLTALAAHVPATQLWQASHLGGHRFAPNVVVLPWGVQLGRLAPGRAREVAALLAERRIPLDAYRGRTLYEAPVQAAEIAVRRRFGFDGIGDLHLLSHEGDEVRFLTPEGEVGARVAQTWGPSIPVSCGDAPAPTSGWRAELDSACA